MDRWAERLLTMRYRIHHIDRAENRLADLGSRWGNRFASAKAKEGAVPGDFSPKKFLHGFMGRSKGTTAARKQCKCQFGGAGVEEGCPVAEVASKKVLWTPSPAVTKKVKFPDRSLKEEEMFPRNLGLVNAERLRTSQEKFAGKRPPGVLYTGGERGWWVNKEGAK